MAPTACSRPRGFTLIELLVVIAIIALLIGIGVVTYSLMKRAEGVLKVRTIAVLPFKPLVADNRDEPLEMGLCDALITKLSGLEKLVVRPTSSVVRYNKLGQDPLVAGREIAVGQAVVVAQLGRVFRCAVLLQVDGRRAHYALDRHYPARD